MKASPNQICTAFAGPHKIASGGIVEVAGAVRRWLDQDAAATPLIFDDRSGMTIEVDLRGSVEEVRGRIEAPEGPSPERNGPGRPKLGVVSKEVGLLPRHWDWLATQPGGASSTLRKLVEEASKLRRPQDEARLAQEAAYRFLSVMAGDLPLYEEALRAFYKRDGKKFDTIVELWPRDVRDHAKKLAAPHLEAK